MYICTTVLQFLADFFSEPKLSALAELISLLWNFESYLDSA
jgi:hypothetical protein